jgi:hypothetical protein
VTELRVPADGALRDFGLTRHPPPDAAQPLDLGEMPARVLIAMRRFSEAAAAAATNSATAARPRPTIMPSLQYNSLMLMPSGSGPPPPPPPGGQRQPSASRRY